LSVLFVLLSLFSASILAQEVSDQAVDKNQVEMTANENSQSNSDAQDKIAEKRKEILEEATVALRETQNALKYLDEKNHKEAIKSLENATGKLEVILAREPELALVPIDVKLSTFDLYSDTQTIEFAKEQVIEALKENRVQDARELIGNLRSETVISVSNLPMASYPDAIKEAVKYIDMENYQEAKAVLQTALSSMIVTKTVIPQPLLNAEKFLSAAEILAEKDDRSDDENRSLDVLLNAANSQLEMAQALGYGTEKTFDGLFDQIEKIKGKTKGGQSGTGFFDKIKSFMGIAVDSSQPDNVEIKDNSEKSEKE